jgi:hypothetical protein
VLTWAAVVVPGRLWGLAMLVVVGARRDPPRHDRITP